MSSPVMDAKVAAYRLMLVRYSEQVRDMISSNVLESEIERARFAIDKGYRFEVSHGLQRFCEDALKLTHQLHAIDQV